MQVRTMLQEEHTQTHRHTDTDTHTHTAAGEREGFILNVFLHKGLFVAQRWCQQAAAE